jgi:trk system potassium uptake protein TrkH
MTNPSEGGEGAARCMRLAMQDAQLTPDKIGYVNAHGTSTGAGDVAETLALKSVFKDQASKVWVSSTKSMIGHLLGAAGGIEAVISVLAFNNAGFGLLNNNLVNFATDPVINTVITGLIILGGLGYPVIIAIHLYIRKKIIHKRDHVQKNLEEQVAGVVASPLQTRVAILGTILFLGLGMIIPLFIDFHNPALRDLSFTGKIITMFFQSVSTRTAGFNTIDIGALSVATLFLYIALMYIGANPAGTAGGIKIPTVVVLYGYIKDWFHAPGQPILIRGRRVSKFALSHAIRLFFFSLLFIALVTFLICIIEGLWILTPDSNINFFKIFFEIVSAFGTVGLSMGFTGSATSLSAILHPASKIIIALTMLFGRLGPLTVLAALPWKKKYATHPLSPDFENTEKMQIG